MTWIIIVEWLARLILAGMIFLSVWSISIILNRKKFFSRWKDLESFDSLSGNLDSGLKSEIDPRAEFLSKIESYPVDSYDQIFVAYRNESQKDWGQGLNILGTLGSTTPFIGLLGTILGIIVSFGELSQNSADMNAVMFSLAEALILTAVGLGVAIPAVIAFNLFNKTINQMIKDVESVKELKKAQIQKKST